jgi:hypothetical protein
MGKYKIYLSQYVTAKVNLEFEVESDKSREEFEDEVLEHIEDWERLARFNPKFDKFPGNFVDETYTNDLLYEGEAGDEIDVYIEELK